MNNLNIFALEQWSKLVDSDDAKNVQQLNIKSKVNGNVDACLNLDVKNRIGFKIVEMSGEPFIQYNDINNSGLVDLQHFEETFITKMQANYIDFAFFHNVREDSQLYSLLKKNGTIIAEKQAPYIDLTDMNSLEDYYLKLSSSNRKSKRRSAKKIDAAFKCEYISLVDEQISGEDFDMIINLKKQQLKRQGLTSRLFASSAKMERLKSIIFAPHNPFKSVVFILKCDGEIAAAEIGYLYDNVYYSFIGTLASEFYSYSPGTCQRLKIIEWAFINGATKIDLLAPGDAYKFNWTGDNYVKVFDIILPFTLKGRICGNFYYKILRPKLKQAYLFAKNKMK